jgi:hypothetical protein
MTTCVPKRCPYRPDTSPPLRQRRELWSETKNSSTYAPITRGAQVQKDVQTAEAKLWAENGPIKSSREAKFQFGRL